MTSKLNQTQYAQLDLVTYFSTVACLLVVFFNLLFFFYTQMLPKIAEVLKINNKVEQMALKKQKRNIKRTTTRKDLNLFLNNILVKVKSILK